MADPTRDAIEQALVTLVRDQGQWIARDPVRVRTLLQHTFANSPVAQSRELEAAVAAVEYGVFDVLSAATDPSQIDALTNQLDTERGLTTDESQWAVRSWATAAGLALPGGQPPTGGIGTGTVALQPPGQPGAPATPGVAYPAAAAGAAAAAAVPPDPAAYPPQPAAYPQQPAAGYPQQPQPPGYPQPPAQPYQQPATPQPPPTAPQPDYPTFQQQGPPPTAPGYAAGGYQPPPGGPPGAPPPGSTGSSSGSGSRVALLIGICVLALILLGGAVAFFVTRGGEEAGPTATTAAPATTKRSTTTTEDNGDDESSTTKRSTSSTRRATTTTEDTTTTTAAPTTTADPPLDWTTFNDPAGKFAVDFPGPYKLEQSDDSIDGQHIGVFDYVSKAKNVQYDFVVEELPPGYFFPNPQTAIENVITRITSMDAGNVVSRDPSAYAGNPALRVHVKKADSETEILGTIAGNRVYILYAVGAPDLTKGDFPRFLAGFHLR